MQASLPEGCLDAKGVSEKVVSSLAEESLTEGLAEGCFAEGCLAEGGLAKCDQKGLLEAQKGISRGRSA